MTTTIAPRMKSMNLSRNKKRNRKEFEADNSEHGDDVNTLMPINPNKKIKLSNNENTSTSLPQTRSITASLSSSKDTTSKKRTFSETEFCDDPLLKECSPNSKKIKIIDAHRIELSDRMDVDIATESTLDIKHRKETLDAMDVDEETKNEKLSSTMKRIKLKFPSNRIRRSGLEFCIECGIGLMA